MWAMQVLELEAHAYLVYVIIFFSGMFGFHLFLLTKSSSNVSNSSLTGGDYTAVRVSDIEQHDSLEEDRDLNALDDIDLDDLEQDII